MPDTITLSIDELQRIKCQQEIKGMTRFAWWKDGVQYVGTCGRLLRNAIADVEREYRVESEQMNAMASACETDS